VAWLPVVADTCSEVMRTVRGGGEGEGEERRGRGEERARRGEAR
jgi:hypothetical protein